MKRLTIVALLMFVVVGMALAASTSINIAVTVTGGPVYLSAVSSILPVVNGSSSVNTTIPNGSSAVLTWDSTNGATSCAGTGFSTGTAVSGTVTVSPTSGTNTYTVTCNGQSASATVTVSGNLIDAAATYCASNGGGDGSSGSPWQAACINAAVAAASSGDTVFLAAGNWALNTANSPVVISKTINLVGAGSGNTFDAMGHPNNPSPTVLTAPTSQTGQTVTRVFSTGTSVTGTQCSGAGGYVQFTTAANQTASHIFFDGSLTTAGGDFCATLAFHQAAGPVIVNDIRSLQFGDNSVTYGGETQFSVEQTNNATVQNSIVAQPIQLTQPTFCSASSLQATVGNGLTINNVYFYQSNFNPIAFDNVVYTGNVLQNQDDSFCKSSEFSGTGPAGGAIGASAPANGTKAGNFHYSFTNSYFAMAGHPFGLGPSLNDPNTNGGVSDLTYIGNWLIGSQVALDSCVWHYYSPSGAWTMNADPHYFSCPPVGGGGMQVNGTQQQVTSNCAAGSTSDPPNAFSYAPGYGLNSSNNSLQATASAQLVFSGTGSALCYKTDLSTVRITNTIINPRSHNNYLDSPDNILLTDAATINASISSNFCAEVSSDFSGCTTTGFTVLPTVSFTLGTLSNGVVNFASTGFTAQYGAVRWLASTSSTTPLSSDSRWSYTPPISLSGVAHGNTVYMWAMDSLNHISAPALAALP
jgi:hypothetical protein